MIEVINPANGKKVSSYEPMDDATVNSVIERTHEAFTFWQSANVGYRAEKMTHVATLLRENLDDYALLITTEMGKPIAQSRAEVEKCAICCDYYGKNAAQFLSDTHITTEASESFVRYQPLGIVLAIMPWNFPFWQVFRFAAPALVAGNAGLLKHASNVPGCAQAIEDIFKRAGFPEHLFSNIFLPGSEVEKVIGHPLVKAVTLTGSSKAGSAVAETAGRNTKKSVLELGGSDAYVVLKDAGIEVTAGNCANSRLLNSGQSCIAAKRFIVVQEVYDEFLTHFKAKMEAAKMGDPLQDDTLIGPLARFDLRDDLHDQVQESISKGAKCILGGEIPGGMKGAFYPPTILTEVKPGMPAYDEELFGPVASVIKARDEADAIRIANDSVFGLGAAVFTSDIERGRHIAAEEIQAGCCFVNNFVRSDPRLPFGGIKQSGYGRELGSLGILEFVNVKTVWVS